ncbi:phage head closure protein [Dehalobacterium formicoaceticum]|uniref:phage head closure protein n=1 Tax=Dehalobacterium formicoaceticum TaxID=51515 RepID=UPI000B7D318B|nr:phage head closure protein [Dehalobacterium formicoaceticum]
MTYDYELTLINQTYQQSDSVGNQIPDETKTTVLCDVKSAGRSEFYNAAVVNFKPEKVFIMHGYEYNGERLVEFEGVRYHVIRTYQVDFEEIELICERRIK